MSNNLNKQASALQPVMWMILLAILSTQLSARDFNYTYKGQTMTYTVIDEYTKTVETKAGYDNYINDIPVSDISGDLEIPSKVKDGDTEYKVTAIGDYAFYKCSGLTSVTIPSSVTYIGNSAFYKCSGLTSIDIPNSVTTIGGYTFFGCSSLTSVNIPNSVTSIGLSAFYGCSGLTSIIIPNSVTVICNEAFSGCTRLNSVSIPASVTEIGPSAFYKCKALRSFTIEDGSTELKIAYDIIDETSVKEMYIGRNYNTYTGAKIIADRITSLTYGNTVTTIPDNAFNMVSSLRTVNFGASIESIGKNAFNGCAISELVLPPHVKTISNNAFKGNNIKNIAIGSEVTEIGENAFNGANQLTGVSITAINPPMANYNTFSYYDCPLYVTPGCVDAYSNYTHCWHSFTGQELIPADKVTIQTTSGNTANITLQPGETMKLSASMTPANASLPYIFWRSTNPAFATVDKDGNVTIVDNGDISTHTDNDEAHSCEIIAETLYADVVAKIIVKDEHAGINDIISDSIDEEATRPSDIYNLQGICLKRNASQADIDALAPGFYIIGGKKVIVK